mmetsp:Transcript_5468/g.9003  ORF Transcript_5468/g.9003 Transcript_5468/m.9003 type:complete len:331 (-) Transcript_5468:49-1041(-)
MKQSHRYYRLTKYRLYAHNCNIRLRTIIMSLQSSVALILLLGVTTNGFTAVIPSSRTTISSTSSTSSSVLVLWLAKKKEGYQFGDLTKSLLGNTAKALTPSSGGKQLGDDKDYQFGDITKAVTGKTKQAVANFTGSDNGDYQFGDLTKALDQKAKDKAAEFTGKLDYQVGDVSQEVLRRVRNGDYQMEDVILLCKILVTLGAEFSPLASALPAKFLLQLVNYGLAQEVGGKVFDVAATTLDRRMKEAVTGDADYALGDLTKKSILKFIGKEDYEFGDLSRTISEKREVNEKGLKSPGSSSIGIESGKELDPKLVAELDQWDRALKLNEAS